MRKICYVSSRLCIMQINHSCTSRMRKTPHFGQFSNGTFSIYENRNKAEPRENTKQVVWIILRNRIFHRTIRHIRSGFPSYARTLCALTLPAYALNCVSIKQRVTKGDYFYRIYTSCAFQKHIRNDNSVLKKYGLSKFLLWSIWQFKHSSHLAFK